jgi:hypothetical protein
MSAPDGLLSSPQLEDAFKIDWPIGAAKKPITNAAVRHTLRMFIDAPESKQLSLIKLRLNHTFKGALVSD